MSLYNTIVPVQVAITTRRLTCQRCAREIEVALDCDHVPCPFCRAELGHCIGDTASTGRIRRHYDGATAYQRLSQPGARTLLAYTSEGYMVTYEGAPFWMHATVSEYGTLMQRLEAWRAENQPQQEG